MYQIQEPQYFLEIANELELKESQVETVLELISEGATVPFIARYRKEKTGNLDEDAIRKIVAAKTRIQNLFEAKQTAINGIVEQEKMTDELFANILKAKTLKEVEDIYKPYKSKRKTKAMIAIENGFQVVADEIKKNKVIPHPNPLPEGEGIEQFSQEFISEFTKLGEDFSFDEIIEGAVEIIAAEIAANADLRADLIETLNKYGQIISKYKTEKSLEKLNEKDTEQIPKFELYSDFSHKIAWLKPYQVLALNRGEKLGILNVKLEKTDKTFEGIGYHYARFLTQKGHHSHIHSETVDGKKVFVRDTEEKKDVVIHFPFTEQLAEGFKKGYEALFSSVENEIRSDLSEVGEDDAISTFKLNLEKLLMTKPEYGKKILAIDPGYKAGCKIAIVDELGNPLAFSKIFLHRNLEAIETLKELLEKHTPDVIIVGNGTGNKETISLLQDITKTDIFIVNESGASIYSASKIAQEEFPDLDSLDRGTISLGRRYIDPLSELVKVPVGSIGVGLYQHDVAAKKLEEELGNVVEDVVNEVGINVNNASSYVLNYISGIDKRLAKKIYNHRPYDSRAALKKQMSEKVYEQAIGFLRIPESTETLDNTDIHPEQYELARYILENTPPASLSPSTRGIKGEEFTNFFQKHEAKLKEFYPDVNTDTVEFILDAVKNAGTEKRTTSTHKQATPAKDASEIKEGDMVEGIVKNVVAFGAFVDIGLKNDGLVHVSQIADTFVKDPNEFLEVGQDVKVKVTSIDEKTGKIQLSMKGVK